MTEGVGTIFWRKRDEMTGEWREVHNEELYDLYSSPCIVGVIETRRMSWVVHIVRVVERREHTGFWSGNLGERGQLEDLGVDERIILKWVFSKCVGGHKMEWSVSG